MQSIGHEVGGQDEWISLPRALQEMGLENTMLSVMPTGQRKARSVFGLLLQGMSTMRAFIGSMHEGNLEELAQT